MKNNNNRREKRISPDHWADRCGLFAAACDTTRTKASRHPPAIPSASVFAYALGVLKWLAMRRFTTFR